MGDVIRTGDSETWGVLINLVLDSVSSKYSKLAYRAALEDFFRWHERTGQAGFHRATVQAYRSRLEFLRLAPSTINQRLCAVRKLAKEAADNGLLDSERARSIEKVRGVQKRGVRIGKWLTREDATILLNAPATNTLSGKRDRAILSVLLGCGLRRSEVCVLTFEHVRLIEERWVIADLIGKGRRTRTVPMPAWAKGAIDRWAAAAGISAGIVFRPVDKADHLQDGGLSPQAIWTVVTDHAVGIGEWIAPHDLRRTYAKLAHRGGSPVEQIQLTLGHSNLLTTQTYLGLELDLNDAPCDRLGIV